MKNYFDKLYNENSVRGVELDDASLPRDILYCGRIMELDVNNALRKIRIGRT